MVNVASMAAARRLLQRVGVSCTLVTIVLGLP
jgi:hypothetical protein